MSAKIRVADDDFDNRTIAQEALEAVGYQVVLAVNGQEALEKPLPKSPTYCFWICLCRNLMDGKSPNKSVKNLSLPE